MTLQSDIKKYRHVRDMLLISYYKLYGKPSIWNIFSLPEMPSFEKTTMAGEINILDQAIVFMENGLKPNYLQISTFKQYYSGD